MSTNDNLDGLSDAALSEAFAVEVAGWTHSVADASRGTRWWSDEKGGHISPYSDPDSGFSFATSADAVLPFLEKGVSWHSAFHAGAGYMVTHSSQCGQYIGECDAAPRVTFARAACIALIRAKRAEKGQP